MTKFLMVTPNNNAEADHIRGRPARHLVGDDRPTHTICGRKCEGWDVDWDEGAHETFSRTLEHYTSMFCRLCLRSLNLRKRLLLQAHTEVAIARLRKERDQEISTL